MWLGFLFLVRFNNYFDRSTGFYWSYMLLLKPPVFVCTCVPNNQFYLWRPPFLSLSCTVLDVCSEIVEANSTRHIYSQRKEQLTGYVKHVLETQFQTTVGHWHTLGQRSKRVCVRECMTHSLHKQPNVIVSGNYKTSIRLVLPNFDLIHNE